MAFDVASVENAARRFDCSGSVTPRRSVVAAARCSLSPLDTGTSAEPKYGSAPLPVAAAACDPDAPPRLFLLCFR